MKPPPFFISYPNKEAFKSALPNLILHEHWEEIENLIQRGYPPAVSYRVIAALFSYTPKFVGAMANKPKNYYRRFTIPKGKKHREIFAPKVALKVIQKWIGHYLSLALTFDDHVYGFVNGKSAPLAAQVHSNAKWVYSIDIKDFFPSTNKNKVIKSLESIGYSKDAAEVIAALCCYNNVLAQGSPASPVLSNITFKETDIELKSLSVNCGIRLSRYADDIVFSGEGEPPTELAKNVKKIITDSGWQIAEDKEQLSILPHRLKVHGLLVHKEKPRLTKGYRNKIRAFRHLIKTNNIKEEDMKRIQGHINYANSIEQL